MIDSKTYWEDYNKTELSMLCVERDKTIQTLTEDKAALEAEVTRLTQMRDGIDELAESRKKIIRELMESKASLSKEYEKTATELNQLREEIAKLKE